MTEEGITRMTCFKCFKPKPHFVQVCLSADMFSGFNPHYQKAIQSIV